MARPPGTPRSRRRGGPISAEAASPHREPGAPGGGFEVVTAANPSPYTLAGTNTYLIGRSGEAVVIDPGPEDPSHVAAVLDRAGAPGRRVALILVSHGHSDHLGAADRLAHETGAPVRRWGAGTNPLRDEELLPADGGGVRVLYTPGHAQDHVVFYWIGPAVLFSGDLLLGTGTVQVTPPGGSMQDYLRSLERVAALALTLIAPGHGPVIRDPRARIAEYLAHRRERERQIIEALAAGPRSAADLAEAIYAGLDPRLRRAAEGTVLAHLEKLVAEGRARRVGGRFAGA